MQVFWSLEIGMDWKSSIFVLVGFVGIFLEDHADVDVHESFLLFFFGGYFVM